MDFSVSFGGIETIDYYIIGSPSISIFNILLQSHDVRRHPFKLYPRLGREKTHNSKRTSRNLFSSKGEGAQRFCLWAFLGLNILLPDSFWIFWEILSLLP